MRLNETHASTSQIALTVEVLVTIEHWRSTETLAAHITTPTLAKLVAPAGHLLAAATEICTPAMSPRGSSTIGSLSSSCAGTARITRSPFSRIAGTATRNASPVLLANVGAVVIGSTNGGRPGSHDTMATSTPTGPLVAFYGDSYTLGTMASSPAKRWSTIVSRDHDWREFNPSHNGLGFIRNRSLFGPGDLIITKHPDIVIMTLGVNHNFAFPEAANAIHTQVGAGSTRLKRALPHGRFIVVEPSWYADDRPPSMNIIGGWVMAAAEIHIDYISGASHWVEHHPKWMASEGLHPNDGGNAALAGRMDAAFAQFGLPR